MADQQHTDDGTPGTGTVSDASLTRRDFNRVVVGGTVATGALQVLAGDADAAQAQAGAQGAVPARETLCDLGSVELAARIRRKDVSAREALTAHLARIERLNPRLNAIVTLVADRAMADAARADEQTARGGPLGPLHGLPMAHKDLVDTAGIRTTRGSRFYSDNIPAKDALIVSRMKAAGGITLGKTNTPELGSGSQTFNEVFGATHNPYDLTKTCGGSSGGASVSVACGMVPVADGSDTGGSLRNPPAFCGVVGLRPSPGRVPAEGGSWSPLSVSGPVGRSVADVALLLSVIVGPDPHSPLSLPEDGARFRGSLERSFKGTRIAWWKGLGGIPFEPEVRSVVDANRHVFESLGCIVEEAEPDFAGVGEAFRTIRYSQNHPQYSALIRERAEWVKDEIKYEVAQAERFTGADIGRALARQSQMHEQSRAFFERYDFFVLPVTQVAPFDITTRWPTQIAGVQMSDYVDWMRSCWYITLMANPALSVPGGFTQAGLPIGLQIVGRHQDDFGVLQMGYAFAQATHHNARRPPLLRA